MSLYKRAFNLLRPKGLSRDIDREMDFHIAECTDELTRRGLSAQDASREARRRFGHRTSTRESTRGMDVLLWAESFMNDMRFAARSLRASPGFTSVIVLSLGLGIGANTAIFSLINALMVRPLPVQHAAQLVTIASATHGDELTNPLWEQLRNRQNALAGIAAFSNHDFSLTNGGEVQRVKGTWVSGGFFSTLGVKATAGRLFGPTDDVRGCPATVVIGHGFWQQQFGGKSAAVGSSLSLDGRSFTIIGVTARDFFGVEAGRVAQAYVPLCAAALMDGGEGTLDDKQQWFLRIIGRLPESMTIGRATTQLAGIAPAVMTEGLSSGELAEAKDAAKYMFVLHPGVHELSGLQRKYRGSLLTLMTVVVIVLLIACANVANLLLARAASRQHEVAVRFALGASRFRIVRQIATETLLLTVSGAFVAVLFANWSSDALLRLLSAGRAPIQLDVPMDARVLLFTTAVAVVVGLLFSLPAAWRSSRAEPRAAMQAGGRSIASGHSRLSLSKLLVVGQVALSLVLVIGAGLFLGTFRALSTIDKGFDATHVMLASVDLSKVDEGSRDTTHAAVNALHEHLLERVRSIPGVTGVSASALTPVSGGGWNGPITVEGYVPANRKDGAVFFNQVSADFFSTMRTRLLAGRPFDDRDRVGSPRVAVINQALARKYFPGANAVGKVFHLPTRDDPGPMVEVIGVVEDAKYSSLREAPRPVAYMAQTQSNDPVRTMNFEIRTELPMPTLTSEMTTVARDVNPRISLEYTTLDAQVAASLTRERLVALLSAFFGALALLLAMVGLYGIMSYGVARRRSEIGVRLALGATRAKVVQMILGESGRLLTVGVLIGTVVALATTRFVAALLYGVTPTDAGTVVWSAVILASVSLMAAAVPAWRAARLDPMTALRAE